MSKMNEKIKIAQNRIKEILEYYNFDEIYIGHSGGKDSSVVMHLAHSINPNIAVIHNGKNIYDPYENPGPTDVNIKTLKFLYEYTLSKANFITLVKSEKMADYLKTQKYKVQIDGTRIDEYLRDKKSNTFEINGVQVSRENMNSHWHKKGLFGLDFLVPIYDWSSEDVFEYHKIHNILLSEEYITDPEYLKWRQ